MEPTEEVIVSTLALKAPFTVYTVSNHFERFRNRVRNIELPPFAIMFHALLNVHLNQNESIFYDLYNETKKRV